MIYTLYNKRLKTKLVSPKKGIWTTHNLIEAQSMLQACYEYVDTLNPSLREHFVIVDAETGEEICK